MSKTSDTLQKAYGNLPKEPLPKFDLDIQPFRFTKYYWLKFFRKLIGR